MALQLRDHAGTAARAAPAAHRAAPAARLARRPLAVCATLQQHDKSSGPVGGVLSAAKEGYDKFMQRYEASLLSSGVGALTVTTYCVARGQSPATAAVITAAACITAVVLNEVLFSPDDLSS